MVTNYFFTEYLTVDEVAEFFDTVLTAAETEHLHIYRGLDSSGNHKYLTIKDMFKAHYHGWKCRYSKTDKKIAETMFLRIFYDNLTLVSQISNYQKTVIELENYDLYQDEIKAESSGESGGGNTIKVGQVETRDLKDGILVGVSNSRDQATLLDETKQVLAVKNILAKSEAKHMDYLDPNARDVSHTVNVYGGSSKFDTTNTATSEIKNTNKSFTASSNPMKDRLTYLNLELPKLRLKFLNIFMPLFFSA